MKKQKIVWLSGALVLTGFTVAGLVLKKRYRQKRKNEVIELVRTTFAPYGDIAVVYINDFESTAQLMTGGLVLENGRNFTFKFEKGQLFYQEESNK
ncbi:DUF4651 domain-containing protein [Streptococcus macacae]|uniref:DUF4651 domain-containing protein n=1 Tax=Streptococcus macacae NCTC 11558 TaxID=764298 RepID=G5JWB9_9STRE|nr:DUF4651 domain-containing protein [Streptococcus macacae]EHJ51762.1 hypothetical protein STRMA_1865 [Streptococcus macacae NCTC 11558]SUN77774.1 Uncharacterised protein [Streptococcus macacae NCTC 11558]